jgi:hypothetical protein
MKKLLYIALPATLLFSSCAKFVDGYEVSPNSPSQATLGLMLTSVEVATFSNYTGQLARLSSVMVQTQAGTQFQFEDIANYAIREGDNDNEWADIYTRGMLNAKTMIEQAGTTSPHYAGVGKVLLAMNLGLATDLWGDVPYTEALMGLQGEAAFNPAYDSQESVYAALESLLTSAVADLGQANSLLSPGSDDLIFGGDLNQWTITAHVLAARYANHLSKRDPQGSAQRAIAHLNNAVAAGLDPSSDCNAVFGVNGNELNQWYAFNQSREDYIKMGGALVDLMTAINDPRLDEYAGTDDAGGISGTALGSFSTSTSDIGSFFGSENSSLPLVTYVEALFIAAEAAYRLGDLAAAADAHNEAIIAHVELVNGFSDPAYEAAQASETAATISLEKIMTHKWVASFTQVESWTDWRRTGYPSLSPNPNGLENGIPRRLPTPLTERLYNTNAPQNSDILAPVWWDQ